MRHDERMHDYPQFTADHQALRKTVRDWCQRELAPHAAEWEAARLFPREVFHRAAELGLLGIRMPEKWGGQGSIGGSPSATPRRWCTARWPA